MFQLDNYNIHLIYCHDKTVIVYCFHESFKNHLREGAKTEID